jgi:hypothetical protein
MSACFLRRAVSHLPVQNRRGATVVFCAFLLVLLLSCVAFAVDLGYARVVRAELQRSADAAAMAAAWEMLDQDRLRDDSYIDGVIASARRVAAEYAGFNQVTGSSPILDLNPDNGDPQGDIVIGFWNQPGDRSEPLSDGDPRSYNTVWVRVRRTSERNGMVPFFFARLFGASGTALVAEAAASFDGRVVGFRQPDQETGTGNVKLLPFALKINTWTDLLAGTGNDNWSYDESSERVSAGHDGLRETNLFPIGNRPGNFGTVDIGNPNNSTAELSRQIREGVSAEDLQWHGGELRLDPVTHTLSVTGDTGISAGMTHALADIIGEPRVILLYSDVTGQGNNAVYTIVGFAGVRIMDFNLSGSKYITIQPAVVVDDAAITEPGTSSSYFVHDRVRLTR